MTGRATFDSRPSIAGCIAVAAALAVAYLPVSQTLVERYYSTWAYPRLQRAVTPASNLVPFALFDVLIVAVGVVVVLTVMRTVRETATRRSVMPACRGLTQLAGLGAMLYLAFLVMWGLNYRRLPMADRLVLTGEAPSTANVTELGLRAVREMNRTYAAAHARPDSADEWRDPDLRQAFASVQRALSDAPPAEPGRLKVSALGLYFRWAGVDGMVDPFALEVIANPDLLAFERPFVAAHEWGHLAGYADEADANFVGWLTCVSARPDLQYSGWFYLYWQIAGEVDDAGRTALNAALGEGPRRDIDAVIARLRRHQMPALQRASWQVYDQYLKANRVEAGVRSYGAVVTLILRSRFEHGWTPVRRPSR